jgi:nitrogen PTS system EIIA component
MASEILTIEEVAQLLRVSERTVYDWAQKGEIPGGKIGTSWRFKKDIIEQWISKRLSPRIQPLDAEQSPLEAVLSADRITFITVNSKSDALGTLIDLSVDIPGVNSRAELENAVFLRERLMSTGIGLGIGVPHVRLNDVNRVYASIAVCRAPLVDYESLDGKPVNIIILLIAGRDQHSEYIKTLSLISSVLKDSETRGRIVSAETPSEVMNVLLGR